MLDHILTTLLMLLGSYLIVNLVLLLRSYSLLRRLLKEPVFKVPIVNFESDDWGPAPEWVTDRLSKIAQALQTIRSTHQEAPQFGVGLILKAIHAVQPETELAPSSQAALKYADYLSLEPDNELVQVIQQTPNLFPLLHGACHFSEAMLEQALERDPALRGWLSQAPWRTEDLPAPLQSRWIDPSTLPSRPLPEAIMTKQADEECSKFRALFPAEKMILVPPTFIWQSDCEALWHQYGVDAVITPGKRLTCRDSTGTPGGADKDILMAERSQHGLTYLVRNSYFEPIKGHDAGHLTKQVMRQTQMGRATLLETHRWNFIGDQASFDTSLEAMLAGLRQAMERYSAIRFLSTPDLLSALMSDDQELIDTRRWRRLRVALRRFSVEPEARVFLFTSGIWAWRKVKQHLANIDT